MIAVLIPRLRTLEMQLLLPGILVQPSGTEENTNSQLHTNINV